MSNQWPCLCLVQKGWMFSYRLLTFTYLQTHLTSFLRGTQKKIFWRLFQLIIIWSHMLALCAHILTIHYLLITTNAMPDTHTNENGFWKSCYCKPQCSK